TLAGALLSDEAVASALASDPALHEAIGQLLDGQVLEGASALLHNASVRDAVLEVVADDADVAAALEKVGLTSDDLLEAGAASPHLLDAGIALADNDLPGAMESLAAAADAAPGLLEKAAGALYDALPQPVRDKFTELGLTRDELAQAGAALPHFYDAVRAVGTGDAEGALQALANGIGAAPDLVTKAILAIGNQLPEQFGLLRALMTDEALVSTLVGDSSVHESLRMLLEGDIPGGLQGLGDNEDLMTAVGNVLAQDEGLMQRLEPLGITTAEEISQLGPTISNVFELAEAVGAGDVRASIEAFANFASELPSGIRQKVLDNVIGGLDLNPALESLLGGVIDAMTNPEIAEAVGAAFAAFASGDPLEFVRKLGEAGALIADQS
ncbi:MAG: hypothetical protein ACTH0Y_09085, partial [Luteimonas sp.]